MAYLSASSCVSLIENYSEITELKFGGLDLNLRINYGENYSKQNYWTQLFSAL